MNSLRKQLKRVSSRTIGKLMLSSNESPKYIISTPVVSVSERPSGRLQLPKDPKVVRRDAHDKPPSCLPSPSASYEEVQYFVYAVLTTKVFNCAKVCPQWVLETCWNCNKTGAEFLAMTDEEIMTICPMNSRMYDFAHTDRKRWDFEKMPSPHARELIGRAVLAVMNDRKRNMQTQRNQIQRHWDSERFRDRLNHVPGIQLHSFPSFGSGAAASTATHAMPIDRPWISRESSFASLPKHGSESEPSSAYSKSTAKTTPSISESSSQGSKDQAMPSRLHLDISPATSRRPDLHRAASLRAIGSVPALRSREMFGPSTLRGHPPQLPQLFESNAEHWPSGNALGMDIHNGQMGMEYGSPTMPPHLLGTNGASGSSHNTPRTFLHASHISSRSVNSHRLPQPLPRLYCCDRQYQENLSYATSVSHRERTSRHPGPRIRFDEPSPGQSQAQFPSTTSQHSSSTGFPLQSHQIASMQSPLPAAHFDTTPRHWPPYRRIYPSESSFPPTPENAFFGASSSNSTSASTNRYRGSPVYIR